MKNKIAIAGLASTGVAITIIWVAVLSVSNNIIINAVGVEAYSNSACTQPVTSLNVGYVNPDTVVNQTIYVKNSGTMPITLTMIANSWSPTATPSCLTLTWNRQNYILDAEDSVSATLMLSVASDKVGVTTFNCNVTIVGTE
jgi:hypothetical protein